jgi:hypothetical protein
VNKEEYLKQINQDFKQGKLSESDYEIINNKVSHTFEEIAKPDTKNLDLNSIANEISELLDTYVDISSLFHVDILDVLRTVVRNSSKDTKLKRILKRNSLTHFMMYYLNGIIPIREGFIGHYNNSNTYGPGRGGFLAVLLFKRRVKKVLNNILSKV